MACLGYKPYGDEDGPPRCVTFCCPSCVNMHFCPTIPAMKTYQLKHGNKELIFIFILIAQRYRLLKYVGSRYSTTAAPICEAMAAAAAPALASSQGQGSDTYYFIVDVGKTRGASLGLALSARPDGFLVEEIASRDGTDADALVGGWNRACAATYPQAMVQTGDVLVRVNHAGVSAVPGADCCNDLSICQSFGSFAAISFYGRQ